MNPVKNFDFASLYPTPMSFKIVMTAKIIKRRTKIEKILNKCQTQNI